MKGMEVKDENLEIVRMRASEFIKAVEGKDEINH